MSDCVYMCVWAVGGLQARLASDKAAAGGGGKKEDGRGFESCSCIYGAPCVDEYGCRDWTNRFAVAKKNGWKGF